VGIIQFDVRYPNGQRDAIVIEGERALIGSASHCDVRLPMDEAAYEHVLIEAIAGTLRAESRVDNPPATIGGMPFTNAPLSVDSVLGVGRVRLFVNFVPDLVDGAHVTSKKKESSPVVQIGLVAMFAMGAYLLLSDSETPIAPPPTEAPELFTATAVTCPQTDPQQAAAFAQERMDLGDTKRERMPFAVGEGVQAVALYQMATECFKKAGDALRAADSEDAASTLKSSLVNDFRARRIRLAHLLKVQDYSLAQRDVLVLRAMTADKKGTYVEWLATVAEQLKGKT